MSYGGLCCWTSRWVVGLAESSAAKTHAFEVVARVELAQRTTADKYEEDNRFT